MGKLGESVFQAVFVHFPFFAESVLGAFFGVFSTRCILSSHRAVSKTVLFLAKQGNKDACSASGSSGNPEHDNELDGARAFFRGRACPFLLFLGCVAAGRFMEGIGNPARNMFGEETVEVGAVLSALFFLVVSVQSFFSKKYEVEKAFMMVGEEFRNIGLRYPALQAFSAVGAGMVVLSARSASVASAVLASAVSMFFVFFFKSCRFEMKISHEKRGENDGDDGRGE